MFRFLSIPSFLFSFFFFFFFFTLFFGSTTARTGGPILTIYMPFDVFPNKELPFGGRDDTAPNLGVKSPKTLILGA